MEKNDISLPLEDSTEEEIEESDDEMNESNLEEFLLNLWKSLSPPTEESYKKQMVCIYFRAV